MCKWPLNDAESSWNVRGLIANIHHQGFNVTNF